MSKLLFKNLEEEPLWKESCDIAEVVYGLLGEIPDEEKYNTTSKLRSSANDLIYYVSMAVGNTSQLNREYDWSNARRFASALKTMYRFSGRQGFFEIDPEFMVKIDAIIDQVDVQLDEALKDTKAAGKADIKPYLEKYQMWKEMNS